MNIKKTMAIVLAITMILLSFAACGKKDSGDKLAQIKKNGYITIATEGEWAPWTYHDESGELVGFEVEVGKEIAAYLGVEAKFEETAWDSILAGVESGRFDIACNGVGYTEERAESYTFSDPYVYTRTVLVVRGDNTDITGFEDLEGKTTANTASSTYAAIGEEYGATVTPVDSLLETIELVLEGRVDATINAEVSYFDYIKEHPDANVKVIATLDPDLVCYPVQKGDSTVTLIKEINACLKQLRENGRLAEISEKYFNGDITNP